MASTLVIMGFRTWRYGPWTTSFFGGAHGAGVPSPTNLKRLTVQTASAKPEPPSTSPIHNRGSASRAGARPKPNSVTSQRIAPGT